MWTGLVHYLLTITEEAATLFHGIRDEGNV